jgi:phage terminase Nu1 subunit (DNA packaging protein)
VIVSKAQFAARLGVSRGSVTYLARRGRLVLTEDGRVDLEASIERLRRTERNMGAAIRWRDYRERTGKATGEGVEPLPEATDYEGWRAWRAHYQALLAELRYRSALGEMLDLGHVAYALHDVGVSLRVSLEGIPDRIAAEIAPITDEAEIKAIVQREVARVIADHEAHVARVRNELERGGAD